jgi:excisionase family DNA binding protein
MHPTIARPASLAALPPTLTIPEAARLVGISRSAGYRAAAKGEIPTIRIGRRLLVPTARLLELLGWSTEAGVEPA